MTEKSAGNPTPYDFRTPHGVPDDFVESWSTWQRARCQLLQEKWSQNSGHDIGVSAVTDHTLTFFESKQQLPSAATAYFISMDAGNFTSMLVMDQPLSLWLAMMMLGESLDGPPEPRELSDVEWSLIEVYFHLFCESVANSWPQRETLKCEVGPREIRADRSRMLEPNELVIQSAYQIRIGESECLMHWILPNQALLHLLARVDVDRMPAAESKQKMEARAMDIPVNLAVVLGQAQLSVSELGALEVGDVIILEQRISDPLPVEVADRQKFYCWTGRRKNRRAIKIVELL